ncbi:hypothetical protein TNCV_1790281 [Trichonephila clavipes]|nr:hypothetical protein TNCV_1790281 [Trichonephila clavipes]
MNSGVRVQLPTAIKVVSPKLPTAIKAGYLKNTAPTTSNSPSISAASSSSTACPVLKATTTASSAIPATSQDTKQTSKPHGRKRPPKNKSNNIKPEMEIDMAPCLPRKLALVEYTTDEDMIIYDVEIELESTSDYVEGDDNITCKRKEKNVNEKKTLVKKKKKKKEAENIYCCRKSSTPKNFDKEGIESTICRQVKKIDYKKENQPVFHQISGKTVGKQRKPS